MPERTRRPNPYDRIPEGPRSDLGQFLYRKLLRTVIPGLVTTSAAIGEYAASQKPKAARQLRGAVGRLSRISAEAAAGRLHDVNFTFIPFQSSDEAEDFAAIISKPSAELTSVPSSITSRLHDPKESVRDGIARDSRIPGLKTIVTEVMAAKLDSTRVYYTVRLVGRSRLEQPQFRG